MEKNEKDKMEMVKFLEQNSLLEFLQFFEEKQCYSIDDMMTIVLCKKLLNKKLRNQQKEILKLLDLHKTSKNSFVENEVEKEASSMLTHPPSQETEEFSRNLRIFSKEEMHLYASSMEETLDEGNVFFLTIFF